MEDTVLKYALAGAMVETGVNPALVAAQNPELGLAEWLGPAWFCLPPVTVMPRPPRWSKAELRFLDENLGRLTLAEIGERLGRSENGVKIKMTRLGVEAES